jgi:hypothetical protein
MNQNAAAIAQFEWYAVPIASCEYGDARITCELVGARVADVGASWEFFYEPDSSVKAEDWLHYDSS